MFSIFVFVWIFGFFGFLKKKKTNKQRKTKNTLTIFEAWVHEQDKMFSGSSGNGSRDVSGRLWASLERLWNVSGTSTLSKESADPGPLDTGSGCPVRFGFQKKSGFVLICFFDIFRSAYRKAVFFYFKKNCCCRFFFIFF